MQRNKIYKTARWKQVREEVFKLDHYECQRCNHNIFKSSTPKKITKATLVHHIFFADKYPQYKYSIWVTENGVTKRNLVALCNDCHEELHDRRHTKTPKTNFITEERFD